MSTTEESRRELFDTVAAHLGRPAAEQLMQVTIPANTDLATREDLALLRTAFEADMAGVRVDLADVRTELRTGLADVHAEVATVHARMDVLEARFDALEATTGARFDALEATTGARFDALEARLDAVATGMVAQAELIRAETKKELAESRTELYRKVLPMIGGIVTVVVTIAVTIGTTIAIRVLG